MSEGSASFEGYTQEARHENEEFLTRQLITYIGNKRSLLSFIGVGVKIVQEKLRKDKLALFDVFSGSGIVARYFKRFAALLIANDLEKYSALINECYLSNESDINMPVLRGYYHELLDKAGNNLCRGMISALYAPEDDENIKRDERVFYTVRNAMYIDTMRRLIGALPPQDRKYFLAPLLSEASIHANTAGVFKGFYKNKETGIGQYGGLNKDALCRITGPIQLPFPVFSRFNADIIVCNGCANTVIRNMPEVDIAYVDPPYNQHPYGSNYFMLNLILDYQYPGRISRIAGIPEGWNRSEYNRDNGAYTALSDLVCNIKAKYVLISFNSAGFISRDSMETMLKGAGRLQVLETKYNTFRGGRNSNNRDLHVKEYLYLLEK
ncbi:MAG: DNA adenine methylase [Treponema sp.]|jgi:adenine-specific DNA-methyltransferase|nr:DNA adenine methylase [Treponema sp.]